jgi:ATP-dependent Clp endopeptidase proteolytic subunit ClpP
MGDTFKERFRALHARAGGRQPVAYTPSTRGDDSTVDIRLYDVIDSWGGPWGISAREFAEVLDDLPESVTEIRLLINSPGGEVTEGVAILNLLRSHKARVVGVVEGLAASAASFIAAGCDELIVMPNSEMMVHEAWGLCVGNAADMRQLADLLDHLGDNIASIYAAKAGGTVEEWRAIMAVETWFSAEEAVEAGLADRVGDGTTDDDAGAAKARFDVSIFNFAGRAHAPGPKASATPPSPSAPDPAQEGGPLVDLNELREALGLAEDTSDDDVLAAALEKLNAEPDDTAAPASVDPADLPEGVVAISAAQLAELERSAQAGVTARAQQIRNDRAKLVDAAVRDGRIAASEKDGWLAKLGAGDRDGVVAETDEHAARTLASLRKGLIPVNEIGRDGDVETDAAESKAALASFNDRRFGRSPQTQEA